MSAYTATRSQLHGSLLPLVLLGGGSTSQCVVATDSSTGVVFISVSGTVRFVETAGGCWQLQAEDGRRYELLPEQAPATILEDGLSVSIEAREAEDFGSGCQVGTPLDVERVVSVG
jgi:hypothetical protein